MSQSQITQYTKADIAFYRGYQNYRNIFRKEITIHLLQTLTLIVFLPIDASYLNTGQYMITAEAIGLAAAAFSVLAFTYQHYALFNSYGLQGFCELARYTLHATTEPITSSQSEESCTSERLLDAGVEIEVAGVPEKTINVFANLARYQIQQAMEMKFSSLNCWWKFQFFGGVTSIIIITILMIISKHLNAAEIVILICYLVLEAYSKWKFILVVFLIILAPILCIGFCFYMCFCGPKQSHQALDLCPTKATYDTVIKCDGQCAICLMDVKIGENIYQLPCSQKHIFHEGCLNKWTRVKLTCPTCRTDLPFKQLSGALRSEVQPQP